MKHKKYALFLLTFVLLLALTATGAFAAVPQRGTCGEGVNWALSEAGILTISGNGAITAPENYTSFVNEIVGVKIEAGVTSIGDKGFYGLSNLRAVVADKDVVSIGKEAFVGCTALEAIDLGEKLTTIGERAFFGCSGLYSKMDLSKTKVTEIPKEAFRDCSGLFNLTLSDSITSIGEGAFYGCRNLKDLVMPASLTSIGVNAFAGTDKLGTVDFSKATGMTEIPASAFVSSEGLEKVWLHENITAIGEKAFKGCINLNEINLAPEEPEEGAETTPAEDTGLPSVSVISDLSRITSIGAYAFENCRSLPAVLLSDSITEMKEGTFKNCFMLSEINLPAGLTKIGADAFNGTAKLVKFMTTAEMNRTPEQRALAAAILSAKADLKKEARGGGPKTQAALAAAITAVEAATDAKTLETAKTNGIESIKAAKKEEPAGLLDTVTGLLNPETVIPDVMALPANYKAIDDYAFRGMDGLTGCNLPAGVTSIGKYAFAECGSLDYIGLPASLNHLGEAAFLGDSLLSTISFAEGTALQSIDANAFNGCTALLSVTLPNGLTTIGKRAFYGCNGLYAVSMPESIQTIGEAAFGGCTNLQVVVYNGKQADWENVLRNSGGYNQPLNDATKKYLQETDTNDDGADITGFAKFFKKLINTIKSKLDSIKKVLLNIITGKGVGDFFYQRQKDY